jgi:hypothetical protein
MEGIMVKAIIADEEMAKELFGRTMKTAHTQCICISCGKKVKRRNLPEKYYKEYMLTALCPECIKTTEETD